MQYTSVVPEQSIQYRKSIKQLRCTSVDDTRSRLQQLGIVVRYVSVDSPSGLLSTKGDKILG
jgi:hypothetical protein